VQIEAEGLDMATAISAVVGAAIVGVVLTPDLTRYTRTTIDCVVASFVGQGGGMIAAYVLGMIPVLVYNELEPMNYMFIMGYGGLALGVLVFATWTTNTVNLYSTALAARASVPLGNYRNVTVISGIVGTIAALAGIAENLIDFLVTLGLLVPPIAGVYLCDFFLLGRTDFSADRLEERPPIRVNAVVVGIGSGILATWMYYSDLSLTTIAPLDSLVISITAYLALEKGSAMLRRS
jgi:cytosine permease